MEANGAKLLKRLDDGLKPKRTVVENTWRDGLKHTFPLLAASFETKGALPADSGTSNASTAASAQAELLDSTGTDGARILSSALQSGLTPANSRWVNYEIGDDETDEERRWLDECAEIVWQNIHASNFDAVALDCMRLMAVPGCFAMFVDEDPEGGYRFDKWDLANTYFTCSKPGGAVDTVFNEFPISAEQAVNDYGPNMVSEQTRKLAESQPDKQLEFVRCVYPRSGSHGRFAKNLPFASVHIERSTRQIVRESGYHEIPVGVPRWAPVDGSAYPWGPGCEALPDMREMQMLKTFVNSNAELAIAGMWGAVDDGVLNPRTVRVGPRKIIVMAEKDNMWPLQPATKFDVAFMKEEELKASIRRMFMADQLEPHTKRAGEQPTATEIVVRVELLRQLLGPLYGRLMSEYLQWLGARTFGIAYRAGVLPPAPRSILTRGRSIAVTYNSPIARSQKAVDVTAMDRYEASLMNKAAMLGKAGQPFEHTLDNYDWDEADRTRAELLGVPAKLIPDEDVVDERRKQRADAAASQQAVEMVASVVRDKGGNISGLAKPRAA